MKTKSIISTILYVIFAGILLQGCTESAKAKNAKKVEVLNIDAASFDKLLELKKGILIDVRTENEFNAGFIDNAVNIDFFGADFKTEILKTSKDKAIFVYCKSGNRSGKAAKLLVENGYTEVYNLIGGYSSYTKE